MAEDKKSFILYCDLISTVCKLPDEVAGKLLKIILEYVNDNNPIVEDLLLQIAFEPIKQQLKRDLKDWEATKGERSNSGKLGNLKRWNEDLYKQVSNNKITLEKAEEIAKNRNLSHSDKSDRSLSQSIANIAVTDTVTVNDTVTVKKKNSKIGDKSPTQSFKNFSENDFIEEMKKHSDGFEKDLLNNFFKYWKEKSPGGKMKFQLEKTWETNLRLEKWKANEQNFKNNGNKNGVNQDEKLGTSAARLRAARNF